MRVVVTYVPAGSGHQRASESIAAALGHLNASVKVVLLDALEGTDSCYRWSFTQGYFHLIQRAAALWGLSYRFTDLRALRPIVQPLHRVSNRWHGRALERIFLEGRPDWIVGTHFFPMEVAAFLKRKGRLSARLVTVITDYLPHALWIAPGVDRYVVGSARAKEDLQHRGVPAEQIHLLGIPVDPKFSQRADRLTSSRRLGLDPDRFTILIGSGGGGNGPVPSLVKALRVVPESLQLVVVTGTNAALLRELEELRPNIPHPMKICGFVHNMEEWMDASDLMISKPGGVTCAEAMAKGMPLLLYAPIPGQESRNAAVLEAMGTALFARSIAEIPPLVQALRADPKRLSQMSRSAGEAGHPDSALRIARMVLAG